jgi:hypothetical protein
LAAFWGAGNFFLKCSPHACFFSIKDFFSSFSLILFIFSFSLVEFSHKLRFRLQAQNYISHIILTFITNISNIQNVITSAKTHLKFEGKKRIKNGNQNMNSQMETAK